MAKMAYVNKAFKESTQRLIDDCNQIIAEFQADNYKLTLRQLYYQLVSRDIIPNHMRSYKRLGSVVNDGRLDGQIDWDAIEDRTRELKGNAHWAKPSDVINSARLSYRIDMWENQDYRPEIWIEKEALAGVFDRVCRTLDVDYFVCRGYTSQSEMWGAGQRLQRYIDKGQTPIIFHFGDHDPSGIDMSRDITDRLAMFMGGVEFERLALNINQVRQYDPPPNPAKMTDSRATAYVAAHGNSSWELDALSPAVLADLVRLNIESVRDGEQWDKDEERYKGDRAHLDSVVTRWDEIVSFLNNGLNGHASTNFKSH